MELHLNGRLTMITGPAKGMGAAITEAFAAEGARLALLGRDRAAVEPVAKSVLAAGGEAIVVPCDLTDPQQCAGAADKTKAYSASKWGLRGITKSFALEVGPHNINVNCVALLASDASRQVTGIDLPVDGGWAML